MYQDGRCVGCGEGFSKVDKNDKTTGVKKPHNYVVLYDNEDVERDRQAPPKRPSWNEDNMNDPVCPVCEELNANSFILDGEKIRTLGFSPIEDTEGNFSPNEIARFGLCPSTSCIDEVNPNLYGVPLVLRRTKDAETEALLVMTFVVQGIISGKFVKFAEVIHTSRMRSNIQPAMLVDIRLQKCLTIKKDCKLVGQWPTLCETDTSRRSELKAHCRPSVLFCVRRKSVCQSSKADQKGRNCPKRKISIQTTERVVHVSATLLSGLRIEF